jgi:alpha-L-rhamnosidase
MTPTLRFSVTFITIWLAISLRPALAADAVLQPTSLHCEYLVNPLGIGETAPRLSWVLESSRRGDRQVAYQVLVASTPESLAKDQGDLWDSKKVDSDENAHVAYAGVPLISHMACFWKVRVWSVLGGEAQWSSSASWTMGLLKADDWTAKWIDSHDAEAKDDAANPITIEKATYRSVPARASTQPSVSVDVTAKLQSLVTNGALSVTVNAATLGADPAPSVRKELTVEYESRGHKLETTVRESRTLSIPEASEAVWALRKSFAVKGPVQKATLYVTALGLYEVDLNGQRVGDHVLAPDWTDYNKRIRYQAYDVTSLVRTGDNAIAGMLGSGWYSGHIGNGGFEQYGKSPALLGQLEITYADGSTERVITDGTWKTRQSPILSSDFMLGETYDARKEIAGWDQAGVDESNWESASLREEQARELDSQVSPPVRQSGTISPIKLSEPAPGRWTYDLGQNMVGVVRLKVSAPAGTVLTLHHAEMLNTDGTIYTTNLRGAPSVDVYTCKGGGVEVWQPRFTFHGFRYVELTGLSEKPAMDAVTGIVLGSDTPRTGSFSCSDPRINQLMSNIQWGQRGNYLSVPTDCPQRDERLGWMGDAEVFVRTATDDADVASFFTKWLVDVDDAQTSAGAFTDVSPARGTGGGTPAWGDAGVICPWTIYLAYGDKRLLEQNLPAMTRWVEWCKTNSTNLLRDNRRKRGGDYGDWLAIGAETPKDVIGTAYFAYSTHVVAQAYAAVGDSENAKKYDELFEQIKAAFNKAYVAADGRIKGNTQCCYAMALKFELLPESLRASAATYLADDVKAHDWHLTTGFVGVSYLLPVLTEAGHVDTAQKLLMQDTFPSWLFSVKHGATTIWERWDGWTPDKGFQNPGMNSFNHYSLGSVGEWLYDSVAGIAWDPALPGYKHIIIHPQPGGGLTSAKAAIGSPYGNISSEWKISEGHFQLDLVIPANTTATVYLPFAGGTESGKAIGEAEGVRVVKTDGGLSVCEIQSGTYSFSGVMKAE